MGSTIGVRFLAGVFLFIISSRPVLEPIEPPVRWVPGGCFSGDKTKLMHGVIPPLSHTWAGFGKFKMEFEAHVKYWLCWFLGTKLKCTLHILVFASHTNVCRNTFRALERESCEQKDMTSRYAFILRTKCNERKKKKDSFLFVFSYFVYTGPFCYALFSGLIRLRTWLHL